MIPAVAPSLLPMFVVIPLLGAGLLVVARRHAVERWPRCSRCPW